MSLSNVRSVFASNEAISTGLKTFTLRLVESATENIGWDFKPDEDFLTGQLRALLIGTAGLAGHKPCVALVPSPNTPFTAPYSLTALKYDPRITEAV